MLVIAKECFAFVGDLIVHSFYRITTPSNNFTDRVEFMKRFLMKYKTNEELEEVFDSFERATIKRENWGHAEHLIVAYYYARGSDLDRALVNMRAGIFRLLKSFKVDLSIEMPYHETLTVFWMRTVFDFLEKHEKLSNLEICASLIETFDKDFPLKSYSKEFLFSDRARREYVEPDL